MKIVISPAKSLNFEKDLPTSIFTKSAFISESKLINEVLRTQKVDELSKLMDISNTLAELNFQRNKLWKTPFTSENARPAIYAFNGDVYSGLDAYTLTQTQQNAMQDKLRILSGLYGILKPLDLIQAYRLEMGTKIAIGENKNLYEFWKPKVTASLNKEMKKGELFVNLASQEYFGAVDIKNLKVPVIHPEFKDYKDGKLKTISFFAKKARGLMVRYILDTRAETVDDLKGFDYEEYRYDDSLSKGTNLIFTR